MNTILAAALAIGFIHSSAALAWDDQGHSTVGEIAERHLTKKGRAFVFDIVGAEPIAVSSTYPDHVRSDVRYNDKNETHGFDFAPYHFFEIPYGTKAEEVRPKDRAKKDADVIISQAPEKISGSKNRDQKLILFRYLAHVVGDVHQPLHIGNGADRGANFCNVNWQTPTKEPKTYDNNLHSVWDGKVDDYIAHDWKLKNGFFKWFGYKEMADVILAEYEVASAAERREIAELTKAPIPAWYNESQALHQKVYPGEEAGMKKPEDRLYCDLVNQKTGEKIVRVNSKTKLPLLDQAYFGKAKVIVKRQLLLAGLRLAKMINDMAESTTTVAGENADRKLLKSVLLLNEQGHGDHEH